MRLAFWIASRNLASRRLQALCALLGVAFGVATVCAVEIVDQNTVRGAREYHRSETGNPDLVLTSIDVRRLPPEQALRDLQRDEQVLAVTPVVSSAALLEVPGKAPVGVLLYGLDLEAASSFDPWRIAEGTLPRGPDEVLLGVVPAGERSLGLDATFALRRPGATATGCVDGRIVAIDGAESPPGRPHGVRLTGLIEKRYLGADQRGRVAIADHELVRRLAEGVPLATSFWLRLPEGVDPARVADRFRDDFAVRVPDARLVAETPEEQAFRSGVRLAALLALGLGLFVIFHLISLSVTTWVRQAGLLGALGIPSRGLGRIFLAEAAIIAGVGVVAGVGLGVVLAWGLVESRFTTLGWGRPLDGFEVSLSSIAWIPALGLVVSLLGAVHPIRRIRRVDTLAAIEEGEAALTSHPPTAGWVVPLIIAATPPLVLLTAWSLRWVDEEVMRVTVRLAAIFGVFILMLHALPAMLVRVLGAAMRPFERAEGATVWIARKNLTRSVRRFAASVAGLALVASALVSLHGITGGLKSEVNDFAARSMPGRLFAWVPHQPREAMRQVFDAEGVRAAISIDASAREGVVEFRGVPAAELWAAGALAERPEDRLAFERGEGIIVSTRAAREESLAVGDARRVSPRGQPVDMRVLAISDAFGYFPEERAFVLVEEESFRRIWCRSAPMWSRVVLTLEDGASGDVVRDRIRQAWKSSGLRDKAPGVLAIRTAEEKRRHLSLEVDADFAIFDVILILTAVLGGLGLMNSLIVSGLERTRELGLLRAVGVSTRGVRRLFLLEAGLVGLAGALLGVVMGIPFGIVSVQGLSALSGLPLDWTPQWLWSLLATVLITGTALLAALVPAARASKTDVVKAIKYE